ncbi:MAG: efflux transporter outer membrane subunit [Hyphomicrobiales bacterium]|nr:MAG: efflux transporter outer membrane subunit [Hyphomicrobiales bacterium]
MKSLHAHAERFSAAQAASSRALLAFIALPLAGCAVGPDFVSPPPPGVDRFTPEKITRAGDKSASIGFAGGDVPQRWWETFRNPKLNRLIESSIEHNPSIQAAEAAIKVSYYTAEAQKGAFLPALAANSNDSLSLPSNLRPLSAINQTIFNQTYPSLYNIVNNQPLLNVTQNPPLWSYSLFLKQLTVSYTLDIWGQNRRTVESLEAQTDLMRFQSEAAYLALTSNVAVAAIQEASLRGQQAAVEKVIRIERDLLDILRKQQGVGWASEADVLTQEAALAQALQLLPPLKKQIAQQQDLITALAGRYSTDQAPETFDLDELKLPRAVPVTLPSVFVRQRPDIRAAEAQLHAASAQVGVAVAARLPNITLSGSGGFSAYKLAQLITPGTQLYTVAANATQPLFSGFSLLNQQKAAESAFEQAEAQYRQTVIAAFENVADLLRAIQADTEAVKAAAYAEKVSGRNLEIVRGQLRIGSVSVLAMLNAQQTYLLAIVAHAQARGNLLSDVAGLFMALGGGWQDQNLRNLPPTGPGSPTREQIETIDGPVNPSLLPDPIGNAPTISAH